VRHLCHATGCWNAVPPAKFMCRGHWYSLPPDMRDAVWAAYVPGQEKRKDPTPEYLEVTRRAIEYVEELEARQGRLFA